MTENKNTQARFKRESEFLAEKLAQPSTARLAVRETLDLGATSNIAQKLVETATSLEQKLQAAFKQHLASLSDESQRIAVELHFAEINRLPASDQAAMVAKGAQASLVSEAAVRQRNCHPEVQAALLAHCKDHLGSMQMLAARPDATLETLAALATSPDPKTRLNVASNIGSRMKISNTPEVETQKNTVFDALIQGYVSDYAPHLVPVCCLRWHRPRRSISYSMTLRVRPSRFFKNEPNCVRCKRPQALLTIWRHRDEQHAFYVKSICPQGQRSRHWYRNLASLCLCKPC